MHKEQRKEYLYYKLNYVFLDVEYFTMINNYINTHKPETLSKFNNKEYSIPLYIIPKNTPINDLGLYNCYINNLNIFCKPFHYINQFINSEKKMYHIPEERKGLNKNYFFIGDIISNLIAF